jgi:hypothetical protein
MDAEGHEGADIVKIVDGVVPRLDDLKLARLQRQPAAETLSDEHRGSVFLSQGHRLRNDGEVFRA